MAFLRTAKRRARRAPVADGIVDRLAPTGMQV
jgi:hypothetical protein